MRFPGIPPPKKKKTRPFGAGVIFSVVSGHSRNCVLEMSVYACVPSAVRPWTWWLLVRRRGQVRRHGHRSRLGMESDPSDCSGPSDWTCAQDQDCECKDNGFPAVSKEGYVIVFFYALFPFPLHTDKTDLL